jgi:hypothetical protein
VVLRSARHDFDDKIRERLLPALAEKSGRLVAQAQLLRGPRTVIPASPAICPSVPTSSP